MKTIKELLDLAEQKTAERNAESGVTLETMQIRLTSEVTPADAAKAKEEERKSSAERAQKHRALRARVAMLMADLSSNTESQ